MMKWILSAAGIVAATFILQGCAVQKTLEATGGSRSDGTVKFSYEFGMFQIPSVDIAQGTASAEKRCAAWGYTGAEPFGGQTRTCNGYENGSCNHCLVTDAFQCTGNPPASR
ncbi:MAG: YecR family lipoprotein [Pseudomonadota bacterium]